MERRNRPAPRRSPAWLRRRGAQASIGDAVLDACHRLLRLFRSLRPLRMLHRTDLPARIFPNDCNLLDPFPAATCRIAVRRRACIFPDTYKGRALVRCTAAGRCPWDEGRGRTDRHTAKNVRNNLSIQAGAAPRRRAPCPRERRPFADVENAGHCRRPRKRGSDGRVHGGSSARDGQASGAVRGRAAPSAFTIASNRRSQRR
jgi:hypothetical protein